MAVTLTPATLAASLRLGDSTSDTAEATRLLAYVTEAVDQHAPDAPNPVQNEAAIRIAGYLFDMPTAARGDGYGDIVRNSGAGRILLPYRIHRAGTTTEAITAADENRGRGKVGQDDVNVLTVDTWTVTSIPIPKTALFASNVVYPDGTQTEIQIVDFELATDAPVVAGNPANIPIHRELGFGRIGGVAAFASRRTGSHTLTIYEVSW